MDRYTFWSDGRWRVKIGNTVYAGPVADKLAAYEDLGEPDELGADGAREEVKDDG